MQDAQKLLEVAPPEWRCIIALARFAGLRCPSEVLSLRWSDIQFDTGKMTVTSPKTAHLPGKEYRVVPIFARLRPYLEEAFELAPAGAEYVVSGTMADNYRATAEGARGWVSVNLRTQMQRLTRRAGLTS
jgi:integrase